MPPRARKDGLPPGLRRRKNAARRWVYHYDHGADPVTGRRRWERIGQVTEAQALAAWADIRGRAAADPQSFATLAGQYLEQARMAERTRADRKYHVRQLVKVFGRLRPDQIKPAHIGRYLDNRASPVAANREIGTMSAIFSFGLRQGYCAANPCTGIRRNPEAPRDRLITDAEYLAVQEMAEPHIALAMDLAYMTGMRLGNLLRVRNLDVTADVLRYEVRKRKSGEAIKRIEVAMSADLRACVAALRALYAPLMPETLIATTRGRPYSESGFKSAWQRLQRRYAAMGGQRFTFHDIRAKRATDAKDDETAQRVLGHSTIKQTQAYRRSRAVVPVDAGRKIR